MIPTFSDIALIPSPRPILVIEAGTAVGVVALVGAEGPRVSFHVPMGRGEQDRLFPTVMALLSGLSLKPADIGAVVCGGGPGSFTSLRIAAAVAKGLAHGLGIPLYAISSLLLASAALPEQAWDGGELLVHSDALRGERYAQSVQLAPSGQIVPTGRVKRMTVESLRMHTSENRRVAVLDTPHSLPSAWIVIPNGSRLLSIGGSWRDSPVDLASWEPLYGRVAEAQVQWEIAHGHPLPDIPPCLPESSPAGPALEHPNRQERLKDDVAGGSQDTQWVE